MADLSEFTLAQRLILKGYRWRTIDPTPWTPLTKSLSECTVALVSSAGFVAPGQLPFDPDVTGGDSSFREISGDVDTETLVEHHRSSWFDHSGLAADANLGFPLDRLRELASQGVIGRVAPRHLSLMGSITAPSRLTRDTAPLAVRALVEDQVDLALLVPV